MPGRNVNADSIGEAVAALADARAAIDRAHETLAKVPSKRLREVIEPAPTPEEHRRRHRSGFLSKIDADPELRAFIEARIDTMTFAELAQAVAVAFNDGRSISKTAIHRWWRIRLADTARRPKA